MSCSILQSTMTYIVVGIIPIGGIRDEYPLVQSRCHYNVADVYTVATVVQGESIA